MAILPYFFAGFSIISACLSGFFNTRNRPMARTIAKTVASILFIGTAISAMYATDGNLNYTALVLAALILGMLGDIFLCVDGLVIDKYRSYFMVVGAACFGIGHIVFTIMFLSFTSAFNYDLLLLFLALPLLLFGVSKAIKMSFGKLNIPVYIYSLFLAMMLIAGVNVYLQIPSTGGLFILIAALLFVISDTFLAVKEFACDGKNKKLIYVVLFTYYIAQNLFALTILFPV